MKQLNRFFEFSEAECLPPSAQIVYLHLLNINNRLHWREWFKVANSRIENLTGLGSNKSVIRAKNRLKQSGLIDFESDGKSTTKYFIFPLGTQDSTQDSTHLIRQNNTKQNKTKTNTFSTRKKFIPPTLDEINAYVIENGLHVSAKDFLDYFTVGNWIDSLGKPVKNWKQKLLTWEKKTYKPTAQKKTRYQENMEAADRAIAFFESQEAMKNEQGNGDSQSSSEVYDGFPF